MLLELTFWQEVEIQFVAFLGAFAVAVLAFFISKCGDKRKENQDLKDLLSYVNINLQINLPPIETQYKSIEDLLKQLSRNNVGDIQMKHLTSIDFVEWLKSLDMIKFKKAFFKYFNYPNQSENWNETNKIIIYNQLIKHFLHLKRIVELIPPSFDNITITSNRFEQIYNDNKMYLEDLKLKCLEIIEEQLNIEHYQFEKEVSDLFLKHHRIRNHQYRNDMHFYHNGIIKPLNQIILKYKKYEYLNILAQCQYAYDSYRKYKNLDYKRFDNYRIGLVDAYKEISAILRMMNQVSNLQGQFLSQ